jgi:sugar phosphate isomerase/epimerase
MKLGCSTLLYGGFGLDTALDGIKQAGFEAIELCSIPEMALHLEPGKPEAYYQEIAGKVADRDLEIESIGGTGDIIGAEGRARFRALLEAAALLQTSVVTTGAGGRPDDEESFAHLVDALNDLTETCIDAGVKLSIKPHVRQYVRNTRTALQLMDEVDTDWIGVNWDGTHVQREGDDPLESLEELDAYIFTVRFRDMRPDGQAIGPVENQIPGKGVMDVEAIFDRLQTVLGLEWVTVEMVGAAGLPREEVQRIVEETWRWMDQRR